LGSEGRHGGPAGLMRVHPASARTDTILSIAGASATPFCCGGWVDLAVLGGRKGGTEEEGLLREGTLWWRSTILAWRRRRFCGAL
jgi:hypothetical protein